MNDDLLSIVIINYNTLDYTRACLESIAATAQGKYEVIVVDNNSSELGIKQLVEEFSHAKLVANTSNRGFTGGNNDGVAVASGTYVLILNNDTLVYEHTLDRLVKILAQGNPLDVVTGYIEGPDGKPQVVCLKQPTIWSELLRLSVLIVKYIPIPYFEQFNIKTWESDTVQEAGWASGSFFALRKDLYTTLHGFDEHMFMYFDDVELHRRVGDNGGKILYYPQLRIKHFGGMSSAHVPGKVVRYQYQSTVYFFKKHHSYIASRFFYIITKLVFASWFCLFGVLSYIKRGSELIRRKRDLFWLLLTA